MLESLIPLGFMPSAISQGSWVSICPAQQSALFNVIQHPHHHMHSEFPSDGSESDETQMSAKAHCDWGSSIMSFILPIAPHVPYFLKISTFINLNYFPHYYKRMLVTTSNRDPP